MEDKAFENVKNQIGRCGIWCGSCVVGNGTLHTLAKRCELVIGGYGVDEWGAQDFDGKELMKGMRSIQTIPICQGCVRGGGNSECRIRLCVSDKELSDCMECDDIHGCKNIEALQKVRSGSSKVGMRVKTAEDTACQQRELIGKWTTQIKSYCHCCGEGNHDQD